MWLLENIQAQHPQRRRFRNQRCPIRHGERRMPEVGSEVQNPIGRTPAALCGISLQFSANQNIKYDIEVAEAGWRISPNGGESAHIPVGKPRIQVKSHAVTPFKIVKSGLKSPGRDARKALLRAILSEIACKRHRLRSWIAYGLLRVREAFRQLRRVYKNRRLGGNRRKQ